MIKHLEIETPSLRWRVAFWVFPVFSNCIEDRMNFRMGRKILQNREWVFIFFIKAKEKSHLQGFHRVLKSDEVWYLSLLAIPLNVPYAFILMDVIINGTIGW